MQHAYLARALKWEPVVLAYLSSKFASVKTRRKL